LNSPKIAIILKTNKQIDKHVFVILNYQISRWIDIKQKSQSENVYPNKLTQHVLPSISL